MSLSILPAIAGVLFAIGASVALWWLTRQITTLADAVVDLSVRQAAATSRTRALEAQLEGVTESVAHLAHTITPPLDDEEDTGL